MVTLKYHPQNASFKWNHSSLHIRILQHSWCISYHPVNLLSQDWCLLCTETRASLKCHISANHLQKEKGFFFLNRALMLSEGFFCLLSSERSETKYTTSTAICRQWAPGHRGRGKLWSGDRSKRRRNDLSIIGRSWPSCKGTQSDEETQEGKCVWSFKCSV